MTTRVEAGDFTGVGPASSALTASTTALQTVSKISTWPWRQDTLRGFVGALGLPLTVWMITQVLLRLLPKP